MGCIYEIIPKKEVRLCFSLRVSFQKLLHGGAFTSIPDLGSPYLTVPLSKQFYCVVWAFHIHSDLHDFVHSIHLPRVPSSPATPGLLLTHHNSSMPQALRSFKHRLEFLFSFFLLLSPTSSLLFSLFCLILSPFLLYFLSFPLLLFYFFDYF